VASERWCFEQACLRGSLQGLFADGAAAAARPRRAQNAKHRAASTATRRASAALASVIVKLARQGGNFGLGRAEQGRARGQAREEIFRRIRPRGCNCTHRAQAGQAQLLRQHIGSVRATSTGSRGASGPGGTAQRRKGGREAEEGSSGRPARRCRVVRVANNEALDAELRKGSVRPVVGATS